MATVQRKFGPADHGRFVSADDLDGAEYEPGYRYEIIDGRFCVAPAPNTAEDYLNTWLYNRLSGYALDRPEVIDYVT
ncbi:MAG: hypothetical protein ACRC7O_12400, partial [Fimbriiglobus sp.]